MARDEKRMIKLKVSGMTCGHCELAVKQALRNVPGVQRVVKVSRRREEVIVDGEPDVGALVAAINAQGYQAEPEA